MNSLFDDGPDERDSGPALRKTRMPTFGRAARMIGLDVGASMIKAVVLERREDGVALREAALTATPPGVVTEGILTDGIAVARALKSLWNDYSVQEQRVATVVSGERVFVQMDRIDGEDFAVSVQEKIADALTYSPDRAISGYQEVAGGAVWAAAPTESVDWIRETVRLSSKTPVLVQTQGLALANAYAYSCQPGADEAVLLLHVGARRASLILMLGEVPLYGRDVVINVDWPASTRSIAERVGGALDLHWDQIELRADISRILLSGGACRAPELKQAIERRTDRPVHELDAFLRISYSPGAGPGRVVAEHRGSLAVAAGLALQGLEDL